jgi:aspartate racemase
VDFIVIACNTAHYWLNDLQKAVRVPVYNMISGAASYIAERSNEISGPVLLLATVATIRTKLYQDAFAAFDLHLQLPAPQEQEVLDKAIRKIKSGELAENPYLAEIRSILDKYAAEGTVALLAGCSEVSLLFPYLGSSLTKFDATAILAKKVVKEATAE